jgi:hypothetical protein
VAEETPSPEWCVVGNLLPYPYSANGPHGDFRRQKIFPAGPKLYVVEASGDWGTRRSRWSGTPTVGACR